MLIERLNKQYRIPKNDKMDFLVANVTADMTFFSELSQLSWEISM